MTYKNLPTKRILKLQLGWSNFAPIRENENCADDPCGYIGAFGFPCSLATLIIGCSTDLGQFIPAIEESVTFKNFLLCPRSCGTCGIPNETIYLHPDGFVPQSNYGIQTLICPNTTSITKKVELSNNKTIYLHPNDFVLQSHSEIQIVICSDITSITDKVEFSNNNALIQVKCSTLSYINGNLLINNNAELIEVNFQTLATIDGYLVIVANPALIKANFSRVAKIGSIFLLLANNALKEIEFPMLLSIEKGGVYIVQNNALEQLDFSQLQSIYVDLNIQHNAVLKLLNFPKLVHIGEMLKIWRNYELKYVFFPKLLSVNSYKKVVWCDIYSNALGSIDICILYNTNLQIISLPSIKSISTSISMQGNDNVQAIFFCQLDYLGGSFGFYSNQSNISIILCGEVSWKSFKVGNRQDSIGCNQNQRALCFPKIMPTSSSIPAITKAPSSFSTALSTTISKLSLSSSLSDLRIITQSEKPTNVKTIRIDKVASYISLSLALVCLCLVVILVMYRHKAPLGHLPDSSKERTHTLQVKDVQEEPVMQKIDDHCELLQVKNNYGGAKWISKDVVNNIKTISPRKKSVARK